MSNERLKALVADSNPPLPVFLRWLGHRMETVYGEDPNLDCVRACFRRADQLDALLKEGVGEPETTALEQQRSGQQRD